MHPEANTHKLTTTQQADALIDELTDFAKLIGEYFDAIDLNEDGTQRGRLTREEQRQLMNLMHFTTRITGMIRKAAEIRATL